MSQSIKIYNQLANHKLFNKSINFSLERIKLVLKKLGHPEKKLNNVINILGSSGKFSTLFSLKCFIEANNQTSSAYISPSLKDIKERFFMGHRYLTHAEIIKSIKIIEKLKVPLTVFEVLTVIYIINASKQNVDYHLVEAGALMKLDSTNVFDFPKIQAVVNINKQHLNFLKKKTLNEVIYQKVGFLSQFTNIYVGKQKPQVLKEIKSHLNKNRSKIDYSNNWKLIKRGNFYFYKEKTIIIKLNTKYIRSKGLLDNLCLAIKIALDLGINKKIIIKTIPKIKFEARIQYLDKGKIQKKLNNNERLLIDGCHSIGSGQNLYDYLKTLKEPVYGIWGMQKNKLPVHFIKSFKNIFKKIITVTIPEEPNALSAEKLKSIAQKYGSAEAASSIEDALKKLSSKENRLS